MTITISVFYLIFCMGTQLLLLPFLTNLTKHATQSCLLKQTFTFKNFKNKKIHQMRNFTKLQLILKQVIILLCFTCLYLTLRIEVISLCMYVFQAGLICACCCQFTRKYACHYKVTIETLVCMQRCVITTPHPQKQGGKVWVTKTVTIKTMKFLKFNNHKFNV